MISSELFKTKQGGKRSEAKIFVDSTLEAALINEVGKRETQRGEMYFFDGSVVYINGIEVIQLDALDRPERGYGSVAIIVNPASVAYALVFESESEAEYCLKCMISSKLFKTKKKERELKIIPLT